MGLEKNIIRHPAQPSTRQRILNALDKLGDAPTPPARQQVALLRILVVIAAGHFVIALMQIDNAAYRPPVAQVATAVAPNHP